MVSLWHLYPLALSQAKSFVAEWVSSADCTVIAESSYHLQALAESLAEVARLSGNILHDLHTAVFMREHGIRKIITLNQDFRAFPWIDIRPLHQTS